MTFLRILQTPNARSTLWRLAFPCMLVTSAALTACGGGDGPAIQALPQSLQFGAAPVLPLGGTATVTATASSGLSPQFESGTPSVCTVHSTSGAVTSLTIGTCTIIANQFGNSQFAPAASVAQSLNALAGPAQTISLGSAPTLSLYGSASISAVASSGLAVTFSSLTPAVCSVNSQSGVVQDLTAGTCTIAVNQAGDADFNAAPQVTQSIAVAAWSAGLTPPGAPTGVRATLGNTVQTVRVSFVGPASTGGDPVTAYTVTSVPVGLSATGTASPIAVNCSGSCSGYRFTVTAQNNQGSGVVSDAADIVTGYAITSTFFEPDTQPNNTVFTGTFNLNTTLGTVTDLAGRLTESMTHIGDGIPMTTVALSNQLSFVPDGTGGALVTSFALNTVNTFYGGGFAPGSGSGGLYYGYPAAINPGAGGVGNAYAMVYVNLTDPTTSITPANLAKIAYADCTAGGMMGDTCMTGTSLSAYGTIGTMSGVPWSQVITKQ